MGFTKARIFMVVRKTPMKSKDLWGRVLARVHVYESQFQSPGSDVKSWPWKIASSTLKTCVYVTTEGLVGLVVINPSCPMQDLQVSLHGFRDILLQDSLYLPLAFG